MKTALTIAGSDSSGGAGIQADLKTFSALGVFGMSVITAITAQNTCGVTNIRELDEEIIADQIAAVYDDIPVGAVKVGMLSSAEITRVVAGALVKHGAANVVVDPVMVAKSGSRLLKVEAVEALIQFLFPIADVVTPNLHEAAEIVGFPVGNRASMERAAIAIKAMGPKYVVVKGGHLPGAACDLFYDGKEFAYLTNERIETKHTHGTGCTFSSAIAAGLAKRMPVFEAVAVAKRYITVAISHGFSLGKGVGPTHHFYELYSQAGVVGDGE
ncbi:bifunctional hydroxymethylpyrimidine kinase/phosphomethylpyrimidine kinase [Anaeroselena agilis]|uniref:Hydroxymethylpyrimidine/phosphomethylpyrimidine kinase n=1 Tax=Anaeroselena agilis TaxID=3063788 RepID=A0ABU3NYD2_9FIRM|nr:bifunctional hydroxymethylpyrimidine kinase/phosphomethylpyrimidine kinase [Selenomonadales bacterium 4137-cl]